MNFKAKRLGVERLKVRVAGMRESEVTGVITEVGSDRVITEVRR